MLAGPATRLARYFAPLPKTYEMLVQFGVISSTGDPEGELTATGVVPARIVLPLGAVRQRPPAHSAVKIDGERAYARARRGEDVQTTEREVTVFESSVLWHEGDRAALRFVCSSGTYVRSLVAALGDAYCLELRRHAIGPFRQRGRGRAGTAVTAPIASPGRASRPSAPSAPRSRRRNPRSSARGKRPGEPGSARRSRRGGGAVAVEREGALRVEVGLRAQ